MDYAVTGQVTDGSRGSWVIKCDPLSALPTILGMFNFFFFFHGKLILSVVVSTTDRQAPSSKPKTGQCSKTSNPTPPHVTMYV